MKNKENKRTRFKYNRKKYMTMNSQFVPVKITNKIWADKLMAGEIFMRPLKAFASYEATNVVNDLDKYRGDPYEGISSLSFDVEHDKVAPLIDEDLRKMIRGVIHIDTEVLPFFKLFCLYCLEYDLFTDSFRQPDQRMGEFGDTAVLIWDFNTFLKRVENSIRMKYGNMFVFMCNRVEYLDLANPRDISPIFTKRPDYKFQNELRFAFSELGTQVGELYEIKKTSNNEILNIGPINDIAYEMPFEEFYTLRGVRDKSFIFPYSDKPNFETAYSYWVKRTRNINNNYTKAQLNQGKASNGSIQRIELVRVYDE